MARHAREGTCVGVPESYPVAVSRGPPVPAQREHADESTVWSELAEPPLIKQLEEVSSMAPYVEFDESHANVARRRAQALVPRAGRVVIIHIEPDRSKGTIMRLFCMVLARPLGADGYRGGHAFTGGLQTCVVHVEQKLEGIAIGLQHQLSRVRLVQYVRCHTGRLQKGSRGDNPDG